MNPPNPLPPIDLSTLRENLIFDWRDSTIVRWLQFGVATSITMPMPHEYTIAGGVKITIRDTGEVIEKPIFYAHTPMVRVYFWDDLFGTECMAFARCDITPGIPPRKPKRKKSETPVRKTEKTKVDNTQPGMLF